MKHDPHPAGGLGRAKLDEARQAGGGPHESALEGRLRTLDAVYRRFGREGLGDYPLCEVTLLLESKRLQLRDAPAGREADETQKAANRLLELEIRDLSGHVDALLAGAGLSTLQRAETRLHHRNQSRGPGAGQRPPEPARDRERD